MASVGVLGPLLVEGPGGPVHIGSGRQRRLLVALAAHAGREVATGLITELVWDRAPADPSGGVQTTVSRLRRLLPDGLTVETTPGGDRLAADRPALDVTAFADHLAAAGRAAPADRPDRVPGVRRGRGPAGGGAGGHWSALGAEYDAAHAEGAALGDRAALALARRLTPPAAVAGG